MARVRGRFRPEKTLPQDARGFVQVRVDLPWDSRSFPMEFKLDTASDYNLLVDVDFAVVVQALGNPHEVGTPRWFKWIEDQSRWFRPVRGAYTLAGSTPPIYKLTRAWFFLCDLDGRTPQRTPWELWGTLTPLFDEPGPPRYSLLGLPTINRLRELSWSFGRSRITLSL